MYRHRLTERVYYLIGSLARLVSLDSFDFRFRWTTTLRLHECYSLSKMECFVLMSPALFPLQLKASERALVVSLTRIVEFTFKQVLVISNLFFLTFYHCFPNSRWQFAASSLKNCPFCVKSKYLLF